MRKYDEYKDMKYDWLPHIPSHWSLRTMRSLATVSSERCGDRNEVLLSVYREYGVIIKSSRDDNHNIESESLSNYKIVRKGDLVMNKMKMWQGSLGVSKYDGIVSPAYIVCHLSDDIFNKDFLHLLLRSTMFKTYYNRVSYGVRVGQWDMHYDDFKALTIALPTCGEQDQIVRYLNWQVSKINGLIVIKKKEIKRLTELKKTVVNEAVTHGLNSKVPMKFSGVDWLGDIPAHWTTIKLRQILHPFSEKNHPELPLLSVVREQGVIVRDVEDKESNHNFIPDDLSGYKMVKKGQFVMNKMKAWQGSYGISDFTGIVSPAYFIFDVDFDDLEYFHYAIRSKVYVNFFAQASDGIRVGQWDLSIKKMKEIPFIIPPADEQRAIVEHIPVAFAKYDEAIAKLTEEVEVLHDLRNKLISDVVTGQIDVRGIEVPEFEYVEEIDDSSEDDEEADEEAVEEV